MVNETGNRNRISETCKFRFWLVHWIDPRSIEHSYAGCKLTSFQHLYWQLYNWDIILNIYLYLFKTRGNFRKGYVGLFCLSALYVTMHAKFHCCSLDVCSFFNSRARPFTMLHYNGNLWFLTHTFVQNDVCMSLSTTLQISQIAAQVGLSRFIHFQYHDSLLCSNFQQLVKVGLIWYNATSPPYTDDSIAFARLRQYAAQSASTSYRLCPLLRRFEYRLWTCLSINRSVSCLAFFKSSFCPSLRGSKWVIIAYRISWRSVETSLSYGYITAFQNGRSLPSCILKKTDILNCGYSSEGQCASLCKIRVDWSNHCWDIFRFFKMAAVRHLGFVMARLDHPWRVLNIGGITVQNLAGINAVVSIVCKCWYLMSLVSKCLIAPKMELFGGFYPINW